MSTLERLDLVKRGDVKKEIVYKNPEGPDNTQWSPLFCYDSGLPPVSYLQKHKHTGMKEGFCVERGQVTIIDESPEGDIQEIHLGEGSFYLVEQDHWHTVVNNSDSEVSFLALGLVKNTDGVTVDG